METRFWHHKLWLGPVHLSLVRNDAITGERPPMSWFFAREGLRWVCATLRVRSVYLNLDFDNR